MVKVLLLMNGLRLDSESCHFGREMGSLESLRTGIEGVRSCVVVIIVHGLGNGQLNVVSGSFNSEIHIVPSLLHAPCA